MKRFVRMAARERSNHGLPAVATAGGVIAAQALATTAGRGDIRRRGPVRSPL
jgi:hypothetical protein